MKLITGLISALAFASLGYSMPQSVAELNSDDVLHHLQARDDNWQCQVIVNGPGKARLLSIHKTFNKLFGEARLTAASNQCYIATCNDVVFGFCNVNGNTRTEFANARNIAANADPRNGQSCIITATKSAGYYYFYGWTSNWSFGGIHDDVRRC